MFGCLANKVDWVQSMDAFGSSGTGVLVNSYKRRGAEAHHGEYHGGSVFQLGLERWVGLRTDGNRAISGRKTSLNKRSEKGKNGVRWGAPAGKGGCSTRPVERGVGCRSRQGSREGCCRVLGPTAGSSAAGKNYPVLFVVCLALCWILHKNLTLELRRVDEIFRISGRFLWQRNRL